MEYDKMMTDRIKRLKESTTIAIAQKANSLRKQGLDVISFAVGEPDFDTPDNIKEKAVEAIKNGFTKYTPVDGIDELKKAICFKFKRDNNLDYSPSEIIVSCGAKHSLFNICQVLFEKDDEVIILSPFWLTYPDQVALAGARPVIIDTSKSEDFTVTANELDEFVTSKTKAIILNNPCNPSGKVYSAQELEIITRTAIDNNLFIIADEIYEKLIYDGSKHVSVAALSEEAKKRTITVNGVSKAYAMTGWRIGYAAGPQPIIGAMKKIQGQSTTNPVSIAQYASIEALLGPQNDVDRMIKQYQKRRDYLVKELNSIEGVSCRMPEGAFYVFLKIDNLFNKKLGESVANNSIGFCSYILDEALVALVPGNAFGCDNFVRLSYATDMQSIIEGVKRIKKAVNKLER